MDAGGWNVGSVVDRRDRQGSSAWPAVACPPPLQHDASQALQGQREGVMQHREDQAVLVSLLCSVCGWLSTNWCCFGAHQKQPCILSGHHALR